MCTGELILAEAGLLKGDRATTHWAYKERLAVYPGVEVVAGRVVTDRNRITGGGVTAGIQLMAEYDPQPPTNVGSPDSAPPELVAAVHQQFDEMAPGLAEFFAAKAGWPSVRSCVQNAPSPERCAWSTASFIAPVCEG